MIAAAILSLACHAGASSFTNFSNTNGQSTANMDIIVKFKGNADINSIGLGRSINHQSALIPQFNVNLLQVHQRMDVAGLLKQLQNHPMVEYAQFDHPVTARVAKTEEVPVLGPVMDSMPNDPSFNGQWSMSLSDTNFGIDAINAWLTYGTGGKDILNNDIVVAVVDGGVEITHKDLVDNVWTNMQEIAGNGIDDDENGYVDDINGWNGYSNSGTLQTSGHGTHVAGIVGAKGNNDLQVAGVNWDVKLMDVPGSSGNTSVILRAYGYILAQKQLWLDTNGAKGANVVATNSSFGIDGANCASGQYPAWNDIYTEMGKAGILSAAATANRNWNIDDVGDVPTGCDSPYIISVTNNQSNGTKASAGYGKTTIDLAAPGTRILSTYTRNTTRSLTGTSMATPHVAGAVAFLASIASKPLNDLYMNDPAAAAMEMKRMIMETVTPMDNFKDNTVAGGILNLNSAAAEVSKFGM